MRKKGIGWMFLPIVVIAFIGCPGITLADDLEPMVATGTSTVKVCLPPAWSLKLPASTRFETVLGGEAVLDRETGLVWEKSPDTITRSWNLAINHAYDLEIDGRGGWRLPTVEELKSLAVLTVDRSGSTLALPSGHPFTNVQTHSYWSSTTNVNDTGSAWVANFSNGSVANSEKREEIYVWCVRGGHGHDGQ